MKDVAEASQLIQKAEEIVFKGLVNNLSQMPDLEINWHWFSKQEFIRKTSHGQVSSTPIWNGQKS